jgi:hypothetical protein
VSVNTSVFPEARETPGDSVAHVDCLACNSAVKTEQGKEDAMMKMIGVATVMTAALVTNAAPADILLFESIIDGLQETPPNPSPGSGFAELSFDTDTSILTITSGSFSGLLAPSTLAHIHIAPPGVPGPVVFGITHPFATSGPISGSGALTPAQVTALLAGDLYINIHTSFFPGGEIRGVIFLVPAPGALALLGLAGVAGSSRRRRD